MQSLSERDRRILEFEERWGAHSGAKEDAIRRVFAVRAARYYQLLNGIIDDAAALAAMPMLVKRLQRERSRRAQRRVARTFAS